MKKKLNTKINVQRKKNGMHRSEMYRAAERADVGEKGPAGQRPAWKRAKLISFKMAAVVWRSSIIKSPDPVCSVRPVQTPTGINVNKNSQCRF